jgi:hypothetical protein
MHRESIVDRLRDREGRSLSVRNPFDDAGTCERARRAHEP